MTTEEARQRCPLYRDGMCLAYFEEDGPIPCNGTTENCDWLNVDEASDFRSNNSYCSALEELNETGVGCENVKKAFISGVIWRDGENRRKAVEGRIDSVKYDISSVVIHIPFKNWKDKGIAVGDNVKLLIIKEDEKV